MKQGDIMEKSKKRHSKAQTFFMLLFIPFVAVVILVFAIFTILGINVTDSISRAGASIPGIGQYFETEETMAIEEMEKRIIQLEHENETYASTNEHLEQQLADRDETISMLEEEVQDNRDSESESEEIDETEERTDLQEVVKTIEGMTASKAADILTNVEEDEAVLYLRLMRTSERSEILARMDPEAAASIVSLMSN